MPGVGVKTAPGIPHDLVPEGAEAQWVSVDGDVVECGLWFGLLARDGVRRSALVLDGSGGGAEVSDEGLGVPGGGGGGRGLYEPDGAVIGSGLVGQVAAAVQGHLLDRSIAYVTADHRVPTPLA